MTDTLYKQSKEMKEFKLKLAALKDSLNRSTTSVQNMRENLIVYADLHSADLQPTHTSSGIFGFLSLNQPPRFFYSRVFVAGLVIVILIIGTGAGVTYAAGNSLPGQVLYPLKVDVAEPIEGVAIAATSGPAATAVWQNTLAERRINEATTLAGENKLTPSARVYLESQATAHITQAEQATSKLAHEGKGNESIAIKTNLNVWLAMHAGLLTLLAPKLAATGEATTTAQINLLLNYVNNAKVGIFSKQENKKIVVPSTASSTEATSTSSKAVIEQPHGKEKYFFTGHIRIPFLYQPASETEATSSTSSSATSTMLHKSPLRILIPDNTLQQ